MSEAKTLADALPAEIERVQELLPLYDEIPTGIFAATMMRQSIKRAHAVLCSNRPKKSEQSVTMSRPERGG